VVSHGIASGREAPSIRRVSGDGRAKREPPRSPTTPAPGAGAAARSPGGAADGEPHRRA
jgi:hypothetical protein